MSNRESQFKFAHQDKTLDIEKQRALEFDGTGAGDMGYTREDILESIQYLLLGSYEFGFNPLPNLRKYFPRLDWEYHCFDKIEDDDEKYKKAMHRMIASCDFFWPVHSGSESSWVTASRKDVTPARMKIFGRGNLFIIYECHPEHLKLLKDVGANNWIEKFDYAIPRAL